MSHVCVVDHVLYLLLAAGVGNTEPVFYGSYIALIFLAMVAWCLYLCLPIDKLRN
jgi:hypothetical protein